MCLVCRASCPATGWRPCPEQSRLGVRPQWLLGSEIVLGPDGAEDLAIVQGDAPSGPLHLAFLAAKRAKVDAFHCAALAAGRTDNGGPGPRPHYHPGYHGAYVIEPDGNRRSSTTGGLRARFRMGLQAGGRARIVRGRVFYGRITPPWLCDYA